MCLDRGWRFHRGDIPAPNGHNAWAKSASFTSGPMSDGYDDSGWRQVDLPHDFVVEGQFLQDTLAVPGDPADTSVTQVRNNLCYHGFLPGDVGWYRKCFFVNESQKGNRFTLEFDGVYRDCSVWFNRQFVGRNLSGYIGFRLDVTDLVTFGGPNMLVVRADARDYEGWFYEGGGIYRHVWLTRTNPVHIADDGVFVSTEVDRETGPREAMVTVRTAVDNDTEADVSGSVLSEVLDSAGQVVGQAETPVVVSSRGQCTQLVRVARPRLWSVDTPVLYTVRTTLSVGGKTIDEVSTLFGIRSIRFDADKGFFLNGQPLKLKGVCCHQDHGGVGSALPDRAQFYRMERLREMGCNALRTSHNPPTPELLDACDKVGILVMDETRLLCSGPENQSQLERLILRDRNHPSVVIWSLGNEEMNVQGTESGARMATAMKRLVRRLDPTRPVTLAMNGSWGQGASHVVDVQGCNYIKMGDVDEFHRKFPRQPIVYSESVSAFSTRGIYAKDQERGYISAYDVNAAPWGNTAEENWRFCLARPFVSGTFVWTGFDYRGEPTPYKWPCVNSHFGIIDMCGFPKDTFYYYQAWWSDRTVLHLFPHWNWQGREGQKIDVWAHTNCDAVELFLNGRSIGRKRIPTASHAAWKVPYKPGTLVARGYRKGKQVATARVETTGAPAGIRLTADRTSLNADGEDVAMVRVEVVDDHGRLVPTAENEILFDIRGNGSIIGVANGDPSSHEPDKATKRRAFAGLCQVIVQTKAATGQIRLTAMAPGLRSASLVLRAGKCAQRPAVRSMQTPGMTVEASRLLPRARDIRRAVLPPADVAFKPLTIEPWTQLYDVRPFHKGKDGIVYLRAECKANSAVKGWLLYGADGPVRVWCNGRPVDCRPDATNPAVRDQYVVPVSLKKGTNRFIVALCTNHGKAWGIYARAVCDG